jgi:hypothetical protein
MNNTIMKSPLIYKIPPDCPSTRVVLSFHEASSAGPSVQISAKLSPDNCLKETYLPRFNILTLQVISNIDMYGSMTYCIILTKVNCSFLQANIVALVNSTLSSSRGFVNQIHSLILCKRTLYSVSYPEVSMDFCFWNSN